MISAICAATLLAASAAYADKGGERLVTLTKASKAAPAEAIKASPAAAPVAHRCANCADTLVTVVDRATKGPNHAVSKVARHTCAACDTKITTVGVGKAKTDVAVHSCGTKELATVCCVGK